jgi:pre-mRNA-splicing factor CDC5/CEF1
MMYLIFTEMEMLQEARARLANTQGKKAKRKQREKMLAQAKRLSDLQKRRELKQAGLMSHAAKKKAKRSKEIDLGVEIPFHKPAPAGFHDTSAEVSRTSTIREKRLSQVNFQQLNESRYRSRDYEEAQRKKKEERRFKILEDSTKLYATQKEEEQPARPRGVLSLPAPTVTDGELKQLAKMQQARDDIHNVAGGSSVTQALLSDYSDRPLPTPMRTPASSSFSAAPKNLLREASELRLLERGQTPLLAGMGQEDDEEIEEDMKIAAASTPRIPDRSGSGRTPGSLASHRDQLGLNPSAEDAGSVGVSTFATLGASICDQARQERKALKRARQELEAALAALPAPQFEYELAAPEYVDTESMQVETVEDEADKADIEAAEREHLRKEAEKQYAKRSSVLKRHDLPRPENISDASFGTPAADLAKRLIQQELEALIRHNANAFPVAPAEDGPKKKKKRSQNELMDDLPPATPLEQHSEESLEAARISIEVEFSSMFAQKVESAMKIGNTGSTEEALCILSDINSKASQCGAENMVYGSKGWCQSNSPSDLEDSMRLEAETLAQATEIVKRKNDKLESKLGLITGGYAKRAEKLGGNIMQSFSNLNNATIEEYVYRMLQVNETQGGTGRIESLKLEITRLRKQEACLQQKYSELIVEKRRLQVQNKKP